MGFVDKKEKIFGEEVKEGSRRFAGFAAFEVARVVFDTFNEAGRFEHFEVVFGALSEALSFEVFLMFFEKG